MNDKDQVVLEGLVGLYEKTQTEVKHLTKNLESKQEDLEHIKATIRLLKEQTAVSGSYAKATVIRPAPTARDIAVLVPDAPPIPLERLRGLSQPRAMIVIAKHYGGYLRTRDLTRTLITAGLMRATKNSQSIASRLIRDSERFERITDGYYKLKVIEPQAHQEAETTTENRRVQ
jgi:hypothetical protein